MNKNVLRGLVSAGVVVGYMSHANAVIDITAATGGIADAGVAILAIIAALLAMSVSIFGLAKAYGFIKRKAGA